MYHKIRFAPFSEFIQQNTIYESVKRSYETKIADVKIQPEGSVTAVALGTYSYKVVILFNSKRIITARCECPYDKKGVCKHIIRTIYEADPKVADYYEPRNHEEKRKEKNVEPIEENGGMRLPGVSWKDMNDQIIDKLRLYKPTNRWFSPYSYHWGEGNYLYQNIEATFHHEGEEVQLQIREDEKGMFFKCSCKAGNHSLCSHLGKALDLRESNLYKVVFNLEERKRQLKAACASYGFDSDKVDAESLFEFRNKYGDLKLESKANLIRVNPRALEQEHQQILQLAPLPWEDKEGETTDILVADYNRYQGNLALKLMRAKVSKSGGLKSPIETVETNRLMELAGNPQEFQFFQALTKTNHFHHLNLHQPEFDHAHDTYRTLLKNPKKYPLYLFEDDGGKVTPSKLVEFTIKVSAVYPRIEIVEKGEFFEVNCKFEFDNRNLSSSSFKLIENMFVRYDKQFYFFDSKLAIRLHHYFSTNNHRLFVHAEQFPTYKEKFLDPLENQVPVHYSFIRKPEKRAVSAKVKQPDEVAKHLYLTESENYIVLTPAVRYGESEIPLLSRRTLYETLPDGSREERPRNEWLERGFVKLLQDLHPEFDPNNGREFFYLHRNEFLESGWFLDAFDKLRSDNVQIFGFAQLSKNRYNPNKATVQTSLASGIDWFDVHTKVKFGEQEARLEDLQKAILKRSGFVELGDGTQGILPEAWIDQFGQFFRSAEINGEFLRVSKSNFQLIDDVFREEAIDLQVRKELHELTDKLANFKSISQTRIPKKLKATLRDYQKEGLNWLNFLDEFGFGGCLADDMGLGKTLQLIAYILTQHEKGRKEPNLIVMPTSLIFNWKNELKKFAPHLKVHELTGIKRNTAAVEFNKYDVILTTYGTLLLDIEILRKFRFNLVVLDESQAIKNPNSKRYKAARLLNGRQNLVLTGTPIENNTFDLFAQLSFTMPGLLGTARTFQELYSTPIDKFGDTKRAKELQRKVHPFILRRTKKQVAKELPEKTEMVVYCEMGDVQRKLYNTYKKEFQAMLQGKSEDEIRKNQALVLQGMMKLRQICNSAANLGDDEDYGDESAKINELITQIQDKKREHKILVFSQFVTMLDLIRKELDAHGIQHCYLTGETKDRQAQVDQFQNDDETRVFLISLKAGGTGLNLTQADYVFLVDPWWNPAVENQAIDRAYRIGQEKHVIAVRLITPDSIEEKIMELQTRKRELADELIHTDNAVMKQLSKNDLMNLA